MTPAAWSFLGVVLAAAISGGFVWLGRRADSRATVAVSEKQAELESRKVDGEEFDRITRELRQSLNDLKSELSSVKNELQAAREARGESDARAKAAEDRADKAEAKVDKLASSLAAHGQWDLLVLAEVRKFNVDFPEPPPLVMPDSKP